MFRRKFTKWIPLGNYKWAGSKEMVCFVRKNLKTGMMEFKTKTMNTYPLFKYAHDGLFIKDDIIDTKKAWEEIVSK